ncbi:MAG: hypothetical protein ABR517_07800 [Thermoanaerobaculia bacterium]
MKSLGELEAASFQAGPAPFDEPPVAVRLRDRPVTHRLTFHGVANHCSVWLNGTRLGTHEGMFGGPSFDVSALLKDTNVLIVRLDPIPEVFRDDDRASSNESWNRTVVFNNVYGWHYSKIPSLGIWRSVIIRTAWGAGCQRLESRWK